MAEGEHFRFGHGHGHHQYPNQEEQSEQEFMEPVGEVVTVFTEANPNYRLAIKPEGVVLAFKNRDDPKQHWIQMDMGQKFTDAEGNPGFILVNKATKHALKHGSALGESVTSEPWGGHGSLDHSILWSRGKDLGKGYAALRMVTNIALNLDAERGDRKHGGIRDGHRMIIHSWNKNENQKWKLESVVDVASAE